MSLSETNHNFCVILNGTVHMIDESNKQSNKQTNCNDHYCQNMVYRSCNQKINKRQYEHKICNINTVQYLDEHTNYEYNQRKLKCAGFWIIYKSIITKHYLYKLLLTLLLNLPFIEQNTISITRETTNKKINPNVARPCFVNEQYAPQKPNATLQEGNDKAALTGKGLLITITIVQR